MSNERSGDDWTCGAYADPDDPTVTAHRALPRCFFTVKSCRDRNECSTRLSEERKRVWRRIQELAATPGEFRGVYEDMAEEFVNPSQLLGGPDGGE